jgi:NADH:ubiquinone oxidoreductase subunit 6 (subunit J)
MIMTVYLWHITVMIVFVAVLYLSGGIGLGLAPGTPEWWYSRPLWVAVLIVLLVPVALIMSPMERRPRSAEEGIPPAARQIAGASMLCLGIALLAMYGYGGGPVQYLDIMSFAMVIVGAGVSGVLPAIRRTRRS